MINVFLKHEIVKFGLTDIIYYFVLGRKSHDFAPMYNHIRRKFGIIYPFQGSLMALHSVLYSKDICRTFKIQDQIKTMNNLLHSRHAPYCIPFTKTTSSRSHPRSAPRRTTATQQTTTTSPPRPSTSSTHSEAQKYFSILPPFFSRSTTMETFVPGQLYGFTQPLKPPGQPDIRLRTILARVADGSFVLSGPIAPTQELLDMITFVTTSNENSSTISMSNRISHIIVPNTSPEHWLFAPALAKAFPDATLWTVPGFFQGSGVPLPGRSLLFASIPQRQMNFSERKCKTLGKDPFPPELSDDISAILFDVPFFVEAAIVLRKYNALLLADTGICLSASDPEYASMSEQSVSIARSMGLWDRLGPVTRIVFERYPEQGRDWVNAVLNTLDESMMKGGEDVVVLPAHSSAPVVNGREAFKNCFDFLF